MKRSTVLSAALAACAAAGARSASGGAPDGLFYELGEASSYTQGCFPPCLCPIMTVEGMAGTFRLSFAGSNGLSSEYAVSEVDWTVPLDPPRRIAGSGTYTVGGEVASMHQLVLDLSIDGEAPQRFDSGLVAGGGTFPEALEIDVSVNKQECFDTVLAVRARAAVPLSPAFSRGDSNADGAFDISDAVFGLIFLFAGGEPPPCADACDSNDDGKLDLSDAVYSLAHLFLGGPAPPRPFGACGADPTPDDLGCARLGPCEDPCEDEVAAIARETSIVGSCSGVVRLDYLSRRVLGWQLVCGKYAQVTEAEARQRAQADTGYGAAGRMLSPPSPEDAYVFYESPGDFGGAAAVSARTGLSVFGGSIVWDGRGEITYPKEWRLPATLGSGCAPLDREIPARGYDLAAGDALPAGEVEAALDVVRRTALPEGLATSGYVFDATVLLYPRSVGAFDPTSAEWIVVLNGGWLE
ncbi:MAG: hypothetical protein HY721_09075 [Planctomycetes bacterium]|nr:hypothetical protein [Planctomycetota bacterium]